MNNNTSGSGLLIFSEAPDRVVGKIMEIIEAMGISEKQEVSVKNLIKKVVYEELGYPQSIWINSEMNFKFRKEAETLPSGSPQGSVVGV